MKDDFRETFEAEARELLAELETAMLGLEKAPEDGNIVGRVFRALHTIKGSGAMVGCDDIAAFTHEVENVFDLVRNGQLGVSKELVDLTLGAADVIRDMLGPADCALCLEAPLLNDRAQEIIRGLKKLVTGDDSPETCAPAQSNSSSDQAATGALAQGNDPSDQAAQNSGQTVKKYRILFSPHPDILRGGSNPIRLLEELSALGQCEIMAGVDAIPDFEELNPEECYTYWQVVLTTSEEINAIRDVFIFVEDDCELKIEAIDEECLDEDSPKSMKLGEMLVERGDVTPDQLDEVLGKQKRIGEMLVDAGLVSSDKVESVLAEQRQVRELGEKSRKEIAAATVRVPAAKLDSLVDLVGELVTLQAGLSRLASTEQMPDLRSIAEQVDRLTAELRDNTMSLRMMPIGATFNKFHRLVRDLSAELGKEVALTSEGSETELDKTVIEKLHDPLVHLIRNSVDHGLEAPSVRIDAGKPAQGNVHLSAEHSGAFVLIKIEDDGAGLDLAAIRKKAVERGLISAEDELSERETYSLIFAAGFSTAKSVTSVSGRGVGMDVVKRSIEALRGSIEITSRKGIGTTIILKLPLTLAIIDGLLVKVGDTHFVLPLSVVEECVELTRADVALAHGRHISRIRDGIVPYIRLRDTFSIDGEPHEIEQIVVTETGGGKVGFVVDKVIGEHQTVIKNLGKIYRNVEGISGATILGDGTIALILDVFKLVRSAEKEELNLEMAV